MEDTELRALLVTICESLITELRHSADMDRALTALSATVLSPELRQPYDQHWNALVAKNADGIPPRFAELIETLARIVQRMKA